MKKLIYTVLLFTVFAFTNCSTTAICSDDGLTGNPTGRYKWVYNIEYAEFSHVLSNGDTHRWWEACN